MAKRDDLQEVSKASPRIAEDFLLGVAVILIGLVFLGFQIPHLIELNRVRNGATAIAKVEILELHRSMFGEGRTRSSSGWKSNSWGRYYIEARFTFMHEGVEYTGKNFTVFDEIFARRDSAVNASAAVTNGTPTAYFDPSHPSGAVLDTRVTLGGIRFLLIGCGLVSIGGVLTWISTAHNREGGIRFRKSRHGYHICAARPSPGSHMLWSLRIQCFIYLCMQLEPLPLAISPDWVWVTMLIPPALASASTHWILLRARSPWSLELNDARNSIRLLKRSILGSRCVSEIEYSSMTDVDTVDCPDAGMGNCNLVIYVLKGSVSEAMPLEWLVGSFTSCEQLRTLLRERMGNSPLKLEPRQTE